MAHHPAIGDRVRITAGGTLSGRFGVVTGFDPSYWACYTVAPDAAGYRINLSPDELAPYPLTTNPRATQQD